MLYSSFDINHFKRIMRPYHIAIGNNSIFPYIAIATISILQLLESTALSYWELLGGSHNEQYGIVGYSKYIGLFFSIYISN